MNEQYIQANTSKQPQGEDLDPEKLRRDVDGEADGGEVPGGTSKAGRGRSTPSSTPLKKRKLVAAAPEEEKKKK